MSRHEPDFRTASNGPLSVAELIALLGDAKASTECDRHKAIACYLSAGEGWADAAQWLGGAFAAGSRGLKDRKID